MPNEITGWGVWHSEDEKWIGWGVTRTIAAELVPDGPDYDHLKVRQVNVLIAPTSDEESEPNGPTVLQEIADRVGEDVVRAQLAEGRRLGWERIAANANKRLSDAVEDAATGLTVLLEALPDEMTPTTRSILRDLLQVLVEARDR